MVPALTIKGAADSKEIIETLRVLPDVRILNLDHSALGVEGSKVLFRWLSYGDDDSVNEESNGCLSRPPGLLLYIGLTGARLGDVGFCALVGWLERLKSWHQMNMSISPSSSPDGIHGLQLQNVRLYFHFWTCLIYSRLISESYQWHIEASSFVRLSAS